MILILIIVILLGITGFLWAENFKFKSMFFETIERYEKLTKEYYTLKEACEKITITDLIKKKAYEQVKKIEPSKVDKDFISSQFEIEQLYLKKRIENLNHKILEEKLSKQPNNLLIEDYLLKIEVNKELMKENEQKRTYLNQIISESNVEAIRIYEAASKFAQECESMTF